MQIEKFPKIKRHSLTTLQVNLGYKCNQACSHCHVNAGPHRWEMMDTKNINLIPKVLDLYKINILDLTGGAPELHPKFKSLVLVVVLLALAVAPDPPIKTSFPAIPEIISFPA